MVVQPTQMATIRALALTLLALLALCGGPTEAFTGRQDSRCSRVLNSTYRHSRDILYTLTSHDVTSQEQYSHGMHCTWNIRAPPAGSSWLVTFQEIELEVSSSLQRCRYDNLTVTYRLDGNQLSSVLCGKHNDLTLLSSGSFQLQFESDSSQSYGGFRISWRAVRGPEAIRLRTQMSPAFLDSGSPGSCASLKSAGAHARFGSGSFPVTQISMSRSQNNYLHNADCTWTVPVEGDKAIYMTFEQVELESTLCRLDNITVIYRLSRLSQSQRRVLCHIGAPLTLVSRDAVTLQLRTDHSVGRVLNIKWFVAPHTGLRGLPTTSSLFLEEQCPTAENRSSGGSINMYFDSPLTYNPRLRCSWIVSVPPGKTAEFTFTKFDLARSYMSYYSRYRMNVTRFNSNYCSGRDDAVTISYSRSGYIAGGGSSSFCNNSYVTLGHVVMSAEGEVTVAFRSSGRRTGHGFVLEYTFREKTMEPRSACPSVQQQDKYHQVIRAPTQGSSVMRAKKCTWILEPPSTDYVMLLNFSMSGDPMESPTQRIPDYMLPVMYPRRIHPVQSVLCNTRVSVTSHNSVSKSALLLGFPKGDNPIRGAPVVFRRELCPPVDGVTMSYFAGPVNVTIMGNLAPLNIQGLTLTITNVPIPQPGCFKTSVKTEYKNSQTIKVITIKGKAGCIASEAIFGKDSQIRPMFSKVTIVHELTCSNQADSSGDVLQVLSGSLAMPVRCGTSSNATLEEEHAMVLVFPERTDAVLVSRVAYDFSVDSAYCYQLNNRRGPDNSSIGSYLLPLFLDPSDVHGFGARFISCKYKLDYRPGYSILLKIHHNLGYEDLDFYCHAKTMYRDISPHIVLTAMARDQDRPDTWVETQLEMCHGHSVGSLGTRSELLIDGSVSIRLLALRFDRRAMDNSSTVMEALQFLQLLNSSQPQKLRFSLSYEYVPACPKFTCRNQNASKSGCSLDTMSEWMLEATLQPSTFSQSCRWNIPSKSDTRSALGSQSNVWLMRVEVSNFSVGCPCHGCEDDGFQEFITLGHLATGVNALSERIVLCGEYLNSSRVVYMPVGSGKPDVHIAYRPIESGASLRVTFVDCQTNTGLRQCEMAKKLWRAGFMRFNSASHGAKILGTLLLVAILIGCLLYLNRELLVSSGARIHEHLRAHRPPPADDMLQLSPETEPAH